MPTDAPNTPQPSPAGRPAGTDSAFHRLIDQAADGVLLHDFHGRVVDANPPPCASLGYTREEMLALHLTDIEVAFRPAPGAPLPGRDSPVTIDGVQRRKDGSTFPVEVRVVEVDAGGRRLLLSHVRDVTDRRRAEAALRDSERRFRTLARHAPVGIFETDADGNVVFVNDRWSAMTGLSADAARGAGWVAALHPDDRDRCAGEWAGAVRSGRGFASECRYRTPEGRVVWVQGSASPLRDDDGRITGYIGTAADVTDARRREWLEADRREVLEMVVQDRPLRAVLARLAAAAERQADGTMACVMLVHDGGIQQIAPTLPAAFTDAVQPRILTVAAALAGADRTPVVSDLRAEPAWRDVRPAADAAGVRTCWAVPVLSNDGAPLGLLAVYCPDPRPPTPAEAATLETASRLAAVAVEHHQTTRQLEILVRHDPLTGLPNRVLCDDRLQQALAMARRTGRGVGLIVLDVDRFKSINDTLGHEAGDELLRAFSARLRARLRESDTMARMGGDEFTIILPDLAAPADAAAVAGKLVAALAEPFAVGGAPLAVTSSMGIAVFPGDGDDGPALQRRADAAMYHVKRRGRNGYAMAADGPA